MGTWGIRTFDDDTALDWLGDFDPSAPVQYLRDALARAAGDEYLGFSECVHVLCAAEIIDGVLHGPRPGLPEPVIDIITANESNDIEIARLAAVAASRLAAVLSDRSELNELWSENTKEYTDWTNHVRDLMNRLRGERDV